MAAGSLLDQVRYIVIENLRKIASITGRLPFVPGARTTRRLHTQITFRAAVDAVIPRTPELEEELGPEHVPGGNDIDLAEFLIEYVDNGFQFGLPHIGPIANAPAAKPVANVLDAAALLLLKQGDFKESPSIERADALLESEEVSQFQLRLAAGPFARLSREDRLRAINILDRIEPSFELPDETLIEFDGGLVGQLMVGFTTLIYYSEWQGYNDFTLPPSERTHTNDPEAIQSWQQTGFPGFADGYQALRGYLGSVDGTLGGGDRWKTIDGDIAIFMEPGEFKENDYDTSGYEEPYPEPTS